MGLTISIIGLVFAVNVRFMERWLKHYFLLTFAIVIAYVLCDFVSQVSLELLGPDFGALSKVVLFFESFFSSALMPLCSVIILYICNKRIRSPFIYINLILWAVYLGLLIFTQFSTFIYYFTPDNVYCRGPYYPVLLVPPVIMMFSNLTGLLLWRKDISHRQFVSLLWYLLIPLIAMILQMISYGILVIVLGTSISTMILFLYIIEEQFSKTLAQSYEIADQKLKIKTLQMRPHFVYNTLINIYYLCDQDPARARSAIMDFTSYLRHNFTAIAREELIPFEEELRHAKAYLDVVKVRYEELLFVEYDILDTSFKLPPLTLEPIVENSVKHGLDPDSAPLHIRILTRRLQDKVLVIVEDDGSGFSPEAREELDGGLRSTYGRSKIIGNVNEYKKESGNGIIYDKTGWRRGEYNDAHIGISNVRVRLSEMCGGSLEVTAIESGGTKVVISVPVEPS